jgi:hypothetical protein
MIVKRVQRSRRVCVWSLAAWLLLASIAPAAAQSPEPVPEPRTDSGEAPDTREAVEPGGELDVFIPSEEISEDFTVSFPVDI